MSNERSLRRLGILGALLMALMGASIFGATRAEAGHLPDAADLQVDFLPGPYVFAADLQLGNIYVQVSNIGTKNAKSVDVNLYEAALFPAGILSVQVAGWSSPLGVNCVHLSNINEKCTLDKLQPGQWLILEITVRTSDLGSAEIASGIMKAAASIAVGETNTANNKDKVKYFVVE